MRNKKPIEERFLSHVAVQENGCWLWTGYKMPCGYGQFHSTQSTPCLAHRWAYEYFVGPIPEGLHLDHLCRNRACVHPEHMEPTTNRENNSRGLRGILNPHKSSRYVGVSWLNREKTWIAGIQINGRNYSLGWFTDEEKAHTAYLAAKTTLEQRGILPVSLRVSQKTSRYVGVYWDKRYNKWCARKQTQGYQRFLGYFDSEIDAYQACVNAQKERA